MRIYAGYGVAHAWLVDPGQRTLEVHRLEGASWILVTTFEGEESVTAPPFAAVPFDLGTLWTD